jgi:hypothetical protein
MLIAAPPPESFLIHFLEKSPRSRGAIASTRGRVRSPQRCRLLLVGQLAIWLFFDFDFANHSQISMRDFLVRSAAPPQPKFSPRMTGINANRKESLLDFAKLWEYDMSSCRFGSNKHGKLCEGAPNSKSPEIAGRNPIMIRVNWRDSRAKNLRKTRRFWPIAVQRT